MTILSFRKNAVVHLVFNAVQLLQCKSLIFLSPEVQLVIVQSLTALTSMNMAMSTRVLQLLRGTTLSQKNVLTLKRYSSKLQGAILMKFGRNIQNTLE